MNNGAGWDEIRNTFDLGDNILATNHKHSGTGGQDFIPIVNSFEYDNFFRRTKAWHQINNGTERLVGWDSYNDAGQLTNKYLGYDEQASGSSPKYLQRMSYDYNIRGWLTSINDLDAFKESPIAECDAGGPPPECPPKCDYTMKFFCGEAPTYVVDISVGGNGEIIRFDDGSCHDLLEIEQTIEDWLEANGYFYQSVLVSNEYGIVTITILGSEVPINNATLLVPDYGNPDRPWAKTTIRFIRSNCTGFPPEEELQFPEGIVSLCESYGYFPERCPYRELEESCEPCESLGITLPEEQCSTCTPLEERCEDCESLAYASCETCPLTVKHIQPIRLEISYNLNDLNNSTTSTHLIRMLETSAFYLQEGKYRTSSRNHTMIAGSGATLSSNELIHSLDITISNTIVWSDNLSAVTDAIEAQISEELVMAGISDPNIIADFTSTVAYALAAGWDGIPTTPTIPTQPQGGYNEAIFAMNLNYNEGNDLTQTPGQANGNITGITWGINSGHKQTYGFRYDELNRLLSGKHRMKIDADEWDDDNKYGMSASYDAVGNIEFLQRNGVIEICETPSGEVSYAYGQMDNLAYTYGGGNRLGSIVESSNQDHGYKTDGGGYGHDGNGNMTSAAHNGGAFDYNHLNLPFQLSADGGSMNVTYDAAGTKLTKMVAGSGPDDNYTKDYILGIEYRDGEIEAIYHPEGRAIYEDEEFVYQYNIKDHLGNVRVTFSDKDDNGYIWPFGVYPGGLGGPLEDGVYYADLEGHEIIGENHYYPFGMGMEGTWGQVTSTPRNDYLYNGKERESDLGLNWDHYGFRMYDSTIGRFTGVDPIADEFAHVSTYNYAENSPIANIDLWGLQAFTVHGTKSGPGTFDNITDEDIKELTGNDGVVRGFEWPKETNGFTNSEADRKVAATELAEWVVSQDMQGEDITLFAHSHGGNVAIQAVEMIREMLPEDSEKKINLVTVATPAYNGKDDKENPVNTSADSHVQFYSTNDMIQTTGANIMGSKKATRTYDNPMTKNVKVNTKGSGATRHPTKSHGIHRTPELLKKALNKD